MHYFTLIAFFGISVGVILGETHLYATEVAIIAVLLSMIQFGFYFFERHTRRNKKYSLPLISVIFLIGLVVGILRAQFDEEKSFFVCMSTCTFPATITSSPESKGAYQVFTIHHDGDSRDLYDIQVKAALYPRFSFGQNIIISGTVRQPSSFMEHDGVTYFDYRTYLQLHNVGSEMLYPNIRVVPRGLDDTTLVERLRLMKDMFVSNISSYVHEPSASLAEGMLFGASSMSEELTQTFRATGLSHIIVLSGFNIAILITFVLFVCMFLPLLIRVIVATIFVIFFVLMVGAEMSVVRATLMSFVTLLALVSGRRYTARQALIISLILVTLYEPRHLLYDASLHLSFLATAGIVYLSDRIKIFFTNIPSKTYQEILTTTLCAYMATLPYLMYTFGSMSPYALLANVIVLPLVPLMMFTTFLVVMISPISSSLGVFSGYLTTLLGEGIIFVATKIEALPFSSVPISISFWMMALIYSFMFVVVSFIATRRKNETSTTKDEELFSDVLSY